MNTDMQLNHLSCLIGSTITQLIRYTDAYDSRYGFTVRTTTGAEFDCLISMDTEGNGPGWLDIFNAGETIEGETRCQFQSVPSQT